MSKNIVVEIIIHFINAIRNNKRVEYISEDGITYALNDPTYLLNKILREYSLSWSHYYVSEAARDLWIKLTNDTEGKLWKETWSSKQVICVNEEEISIPMYKGNSKKSYKEKAFIKGDIFIYSHIFHDEHMIPIHDIINELVNLDIVDEENVIKVLDKIYICRILKEENADINRSYNRSIVLEEVEKEDYKNIKIIKDFFK